MSRFLPTWCRQFKVAFAKNRKLLIRRPIHLSIILLSSVASVIFAWLAGRDVRGPQGEFPPLNECGMVDANYYLNISQIDYYEAYNIPISLNEAWRGGLPVFLMALGPLATAISSFLILRDELISCRWGALKSAGMMDSAHWAAWLFAFAIPSFINSIAGGVVAVVLPQSHALSEVNFGSVFGLLLFLNLALVSASFFLAAVCGTISSTTLSVFLIIGMIVASSAPIIGVSASYSWPSASTSSSTYSSSGSGGAFWTYSSTTRTQQEYGFGYYDDEMGQWIQENATTKECELPIVSYLQGRSYMTAEERNEVSKEEMFQGCYVVGSGPSIFTHKASSFLFWFFLPQTHFFLAWSNILGYTQLPGNSFSFAQSSISPEDLAQEALSNYRGGASPLYDSSNTNGTSLFPQGSTVIPELYIPLDYYYTSAFDDLSNCPSPSISDMCSSLDYNNCQSPVVGYPSDSSPSVNDCIGFLASLILIYYTLTVYWTQVFPMGNGAAMKFYFPFIPAYWCSGSGSKNGQKDTPEDNDESGGRVGIEVMNVRKTYGKVEALKPFSISMKIGEVTALLGHNGAGKSTLVNLICCEKSPSGADGDIVVLGKSVRSDTHAVRCMVGECKQDDFLWPTLSARDHLELFGGVRCSNLRNGADNDLPVKIQQSLESVDLDNVQYDYSSSYSGGMKRRLSVAIATIGDAPVVVLDEPTTGMDPVSRRFVWKHIDSIKEGRVILLTTHAMEEADLLSDTVAIMNGGSLSAVGSPIELKTQYGSALEFKLITKKENILFTAETIKKHFLNSDWVNIEMSDSGFITLNIKKVCSDDRSGGDGVPLSTLSEFIGWLEGDDSSVEEYGFSNSSLEEVFLAVTHKSSASNTLGNGRSEKRCCCKTQKKTNAETSIDTESSNVVPQQIAAFDRGPKANISDYERSLSIKGQTIAITRFFLDRNWRGKSSILNWVVFGGFCVGSMLIGFSMVPLWGSFGLYYVLLAHVFLLSLMLVSIISPIYSDRQNGLFKMMSTQGMLAKSFLMGTSCYSLIVQFLYTFVFLSLFFASNIFRDAIIQECEFNEYNYCEYKYPQFGDKPIVVPYYSARAVLTGIDKGQEITIYAHQASGGYEMIFGVIAIFTLTSVGSVLSSSFLPGYKLPLVLIAFLVLVASVAPGILQASYQLDPYFAGNCTETISNVYDCSASSFTLDNADKNFVNCVGWELNAQNIYCAPVVASILPQIGLFQTLSLILMSEIVFYSEPEGYASEVFVPSLEGVRCSNNSCHFPYAREMYGKNLGFMVLGGVLLLIMGFVVTSLFVYPSKYIIRARHAFRNSMDCSFIKKKGTQSDGLEEVKELDEVNVERKLVNNIIQQHLKKSMDLEANNVETALCLSSSTRSQLPLVMMHKLRKVFPPLGGAPPKVALEALDLHVPKGSVLGLLGKNGAGKTTALKILSGMHDATSGIGLVAGYDVTTERSSAYEQLGNCPQFDCVWKDQSVQSHLLFYARLKGIENPMKASKEIATAVGLGDPKVFTRPSGQLSGGMRRRLSIAVSLLGSPSVVLLDEPTTGLDPSTRNEIWGLVSSFCTSERAVIITTHMMIEADTLCSRIAIVAKGKLKVVGTQQHLKDNYGSGYLLQLNLARSNNDSIAKALEFVKSNINKEAKIVTKQAKTIHISLPRDVGIQNLFTTLYSRESVDRGGINQFLVSQSSLEDVFISLGD